MLRLGPSLGPHVVLARLSSQDQPLCGISSNPLARRKTRLVHRLDLRSLLPDLSCLCQRAMSRDTGPPNPTSAGVRYLIVPGLWSLETSWARTNRCRRRRTCPSRGDALRLLQAGSSHRRFHTVMRITVRSRRVLRPGVTEAWYVSVVFDG